MRRLPRTLAGHLGAVLIVLMILGTSVRAEMADSTDSTPSQQSNYSPTGGPYCGIY